MHIELSLFFNDTTLNYACSTQSNWSSSRNLECVPRWKPELPGPSRCLTNGMVLQLAIRNIIMNYTYNQNIRPKIH